MTVRTTAKKHFRLNFELRSVLLFSALLIGAAITVHAQNAASSDLGANSPSARMTTTGAIEGIPHNKLMAKDVEAAFNRADVNRDGKLSRQEAQHFPAVVPRFDQIDTNHDNFLSRDEFIHAAGSAS